MLGGRAIRLSKTRRNIVDLLHFARKVPSLPVQRRMQLAAVVEARRACAKRPQWSAIFIKAYAMVCKEMPALRRAYVKFPWPQLYEFPIPTATLILEREYEGEPGLFSLLVRKPADTPLARLAEAIEAARSTPVEKIKDFRRMLMVAGLPRPLRRLIWWIGLNIGRQRGNYYGTFGLSVYSALSVESLHPLSPLTSVVNYGPIDANGEVNVRIIYDHRVLDGATVGRALVRLEEILNGPVVDELRALA